MTIFLYYIMFYKRDSIKPVIFILPILIVYICCVPTNIEFLGFVVVMLCRIYKPRSSE